MPCCTIGDQFDARIARNDLARYRRRGPDRATRQLLAAVDAAKLSPDATVLDIGGGIGAIHHHLLDHGFARAVHVDASAAYLDAASRESERLGHGGRVDFRHGDFRAVAPELTSADVVTLDRVVCCDPDYDGLLTAAAGRARRLLAFSFPRPRWDVRAAVAAFNGWRQLWRLPFRVYVHPPAAMEVVLASQGLRRRTEGRTWIWEMELFERAA